MNLVDLRLVVNIARTTSLTAGGRDTFLSLSAASLRLKALEADLGLRLFDRLPHGMALTAEGRCFVEHADKVLAAMSDLQLGLQALKRPRHSTLRVAASSAYLADFLPVLVRDYLAVHPELSINLHAAGRQTIEHELQTGRVDIGFVSSPDSDFSTALVDFGEDPVVMITSLDSPLAQMPTIAVPALAAQPMVVASGNSTMRNYLEKRFADIGVTMTIRVTVETYPALIDMVAAGLGIGVVPASVATRHGAGRVQTVDIDAPWSRHRRYALYSDSGDAADHVTHFLSYVVENWRRVNVPA